MPDWGAMKVYIKDSMAILATDVICTVKDKLNYLLVGSYVGMESVVVYDLGLKLNSILSQPYNIIKTVIFPRSAQTRDLKKIRNVIIGIFLLTLSIVLVVNIFLPPIVTFFTGDASIDYMPVRLLLVAPVLLSVSVPIATNVCIALGYNKYVFYSIVVTTAVYIATLLIFLFTNRLNSIYSFIFLALISYLTELLYRLYVFNKISKQELTNKKYE
jgi:PST family polysaccharide transporter